MVTGTYTGQAEATRRSDGKTWTMHIEGELQMKDLDLGDGKAEVTASRDMKHWVSAKSAGLTVGAAVSVKLTCDQSEDGIDRAAEVAGNAAMDLVIEAMEQMDPYIDQFMDDTGINGDKVARA